MPITINQFKIQFSDVFRDYSHLLEGENSRLLCPTNRRVNLLNNLLARVNLDEDLMLPEEIVSSVKEVLFSDNLNYSVFLDIYLGWISEYEKLIKSTLTSNNQHTLDKYEQLDREFLYYLATKSESITYINRIMFVSLTLPKIANLTFNRISALITSYILQIGTNQSSLAAIDLMLSKAYLNFVAKSQPRLEIATLMVKLLEKNCHDQANKLFDISYPHKITVHWRNNHIIELVYALFDEAAYSDNVHALDVFLKGRIYKITKKDNHLYELAIKSAEAGRFALFNYVRKKYHDVFVNFDHDYMFINDLASATALVNGQPHKFIKEIIKFLSKIVMSVEPLNENLRLRLEQKLFPDSISFDAGVMGFWQCFFEIIHVNKSSFNELYLRAQIELNRAIVKIIANKINLLNLEQRNGFYHFMLEGEDPDSMQQIFIESLLLKDYKIFLEFSKLNYVDTSNHNLVVKYISHVIHEQVLNRSDYLYFLNIVIYNLRGNVINESNFNRDLSVIEDSEEVDVLLGEIQKLQESRILILEQIEKILLRLPLIEDELITNENNTYKDLLVCMFVHCLDIKRCIVGAVPHCIVNILNIFMNLQCENGLWFYEILLQCIAHKLIAENNSLWINRAASTIYYLGVLQDEISANISTADGEEQHLRVFQQLKKFIDISDINEHHYFKNRNSIVNSLRISLLENIIFDKFKFWKFNYLVEIVASSKIEWRKIINHIGIFNDDFQIETNEYLLDLCCNNITALVNFTADEIDHILKRPSVNLPRIAMCETLALPQDLTDLSSLSADEDNVRKFASYIHIQHLLYMRELRKENPELDNTNSQTADLPIESILSKMAKVRRYVIDRSMTLADYSFFTEAMYLQDSFAGDPENENGAARLIDQGLARHLNSNLPDLLLCLQKLRAMVLKRIEIVRDEDPNFEEIKQFIAANWSDLISGKKIEDIAERYCLISGKRVEDIVGYFNSNESPFPAWRFLNDLVVLFTQQQNTGHIATLWTVKKLGLNPKGFSRVLSDLIRLLIYALDDINSLQNIPGLESEQQRQDKINQWQISITEMFSAARRAYNTDDIEIDKPSCVHGRVGWLFLALKGHPVLGFDQHEIVKEKTQNLLCEIFHKYLKHMLVNNVSPVLKSKWMKQIYDSLTLFADRNVYNFITNSGSNDNVSSTLSDQQLYDFARKTIKYYFNDCIVFENAVLKMIRTSCEDPNLTLTAADKDYIKLCYYSIAPNASSSERLFDIYKQVVNEFDMSESKLLHTLNLKLEDAKKYYMTPGITKIQFKQVLRQYIETIVKNSKISAEQEKFSDDLVDLIMSEFINDQSRAAMTYITIRDKVKSAINANTPSTTSVNPVMQSAVRSVSPPKRPRINL